MRFFRAFVFMSMRYLHTLDGPVVADLIAKANETFYDELKKTKNNGKTLQDGRERDSGHASKQKGLHA